MQPPQDDAPHHLRATLSPRHALCAPPWIAPTDRRLPAQPDPKSRRSASPRGLRRLRRPTRRRFPPRRRPRGIPLATTTPSGTARSALLHAIAPTPPGTPPETPAPPRRLSSTHPPVPVPPRTSGSAPSAARSSSLDRTATPLALHPPRESDLLLSDAPPRALRPPAAAAPRPLRSQKPLRDSPAARPGGNVSARSASSGQKGFVGSKYTSGRLARSTPPPQISPPAPWLPATAMRTARGPAATGFASA
jgi:hypothetical protein